MDTEPWREARIEGLEGQVSTLAAALRDVLTHSLNVRYWIEDCVEAGADADGDRQRIWINELQAGIKTARRALGETT